MKTIVWLFVYGIFISGCTTIQDSALQPGSNLTVEVIGERSFSVDGHKFHQYALARELKKLYASHPQLTVRFRIPLKLIDTIYKQDTCYSLVGYIVRSSFPLQQQSFYEWVPGNPSTVKEIPCSFAVVG
jgi:hypothetical protein